MEPMKYLVIDRTMTQPFRGVLEAGGKAAGTLQWLHDLEVPAYAKWIGLAGGRDLLDAFEVALINCGMLRVWPVDEDGEPLHDECEAVEIRRYDDGPRLVWEAKLKCEWCGGEGHHNLHGEPVEEEDLCLSCGGDGYTTSAEFETGMDGEPLPANDSMSGRGTN